MAADSGRGDRMSEKCAAPVGFASGETSNCCSILLYLFLLFFLFYWRGIIFFGSIIMSIRKSF